MSLIIQSLTSISVGTATRALIFGFLGYVAFSSWGVLRVFIRPYFSSFRAIKGPPGGTLLRGHFPEIRKLEGIEQAGVWHHKLLKEYGHVWVYKATFNVRSLANCILASVLMIGLILARPIGYHRFQSTPLHPEQFHDISQARGSTLQFRRALRRRLVVIISNRPCLISFKGFFLLRVRCRSHQK